MRISPRKSIPAIVGYSLAFLLAALIGMAPAIATAEQLQGRVVGVADGDTITVLDANNQQYKIRLSGIDAPEKAQAFGQRSKQNLSQLVFDREVNVEWRKRDRYGRIIGKVMVADPSCRQVSCQKTIDACHAQITAGMAWWYVQYAKEQDGGDARRYELAEQDSRGRRTGLWSDPDPVPPWDWRKQSK